MNKFLDFLDDLTLTEVSCVTIGLVFLIFVALSSVGCVSEPLSPVQVKRNNIINCVKDLKVNDATSLESFEICRQVYQLYLLPQVK